MYLVAWEFIAVRGREAEFERAYGPAGDWARLFLRDPAYSGTDLFRDTTSPRRFLTVDRWTSEPAYRRFIEGHQREYGELDQRLAALCEKETCLGSLTVAP